MKQIQKGRNSELFKSLKTCTKNTFIPTDKCISDVLESRCEDKMRKMSKCIIINQKNPTQCSPHGDDYV